MSYTTPEPQPGDDEFLDAHRDELEREATSNAPDAWVFQRLLESIDEDGGES